MLAEWKKEHEKKGDLAFPGNGKQLPLDFALSFCSIFHVAYPTFFLMFLFSLTEEEYATFYSSTTFDYSFTILIDYRIRHSFCLHCFQDGLSRNHFSVNFKIISCHAGSCESFFKCLSAVFAIQA